MENNANGHVHDGFQMTEDQKKSLLSVARASIHHGFNDSQALQIDQQGHEIALQENAATFVTLHKQGKLRGCIGTLEAYQPLITDVSEHAYAAAFQDPRFPPVTIDEFDSLHIEISVLSPMLPMTFDNESDLLKQLQPHVDGLTIEDGYHKATFLPQVWENLTNPQEFLTQLKLKAELAADHWSIDFKTYRYTVLSFEE